MDKRLLSVRTLIKRQNLDALLISSIPNIIYLSKYSGFSKDEREAFLLLTKAGQYIITDGRYSEAVRKQVKDFELIETSGNYSLKDALASLAKKLKIKKLGIEEKNITVSESKILLGHYGSMCHCSDFLDSFREVKENVEIEKIKKACDLGDKTFKYVLSKIKKGVSEKEIAFEIELFIKRAGADIAFPAIVAFSKNSSIPHHQTSGQRLKTNDQILLDFGVKFDNYCSDMTRTIFFGIVDEKFKKIYNTVLDAQKLAIEQLNNLIIAKKQIKASYIDNIARKHIINQGFSTIPHSLGHGIGIEVHEAPRLSPKSKDILKPGMIFSIEPGIYIPNVGGVRIEDLVLIRKNKLEILTHSPRNLIET